MTTQVRPAICDCGHPFAFPAHGEGGCRVTDFLGRGQCPCTVSVIRAPVEFELGAIRKDAQKQAHPNGLHGGISQ